MKKLAIIGASYLQVPLIQQAKEMGIETHVFAWKVGAPGEKLADYFYGISIEEKENILRECKKIGINGICSIASDLAVITVNYVANQLGLVGNSMESAHYSTDKYAMQQRFKDYCIPAPKSCLITSVEDLKNVDLHYPVIVKPLDRSGSRGITKLESPEGLIKAIDFAKNQGFQKKALIEEFIFGKEYSVEYISWKGKHTFLAVTEKFTTGSPHFIEVAHLQPASLDKNLLEEIKNVIERALNSLGIEYGASHSELRITSSGEIRIIEIGARMGGDFIGSHLVRYSTGVNYVENVIRVALGISPAINKKDSQYAAVRFILSKKDIDIYECLKRENPEVLQSAKIGSPKSKEVLSSADRFGYFLMKSKSISDIVKYLPGNTAED